MMRTVRLILTRPQQESQLLVRELSGFAAWVWPAFSFRSPSFPDTVHRKLTEATRFEAFLFVSPTAVSFAHSHMPTIPVSVTVCCAGSATARAARAAWGDSIRILCPEGDVAASGSEALWAAMKKTGLPKSLLIFRAQSGREWLSEQLAASGTHVEKLCVYERVPFVLTPEKKDALLTAMEKEEVPIVFLTSTEAVEVFKRVLGDIPCAFAWFTSGVALTFHPRCDLALRQAGFQDVVLVHASDPKAISLTLKRLVCDRGRIL